MNSETPIVYDHRAVIDLTDENAPITYVRTRRRQALQNIQRVVEESANRGQPANRRRRRPADGVENEPENAEGVHRRFW